MPCDESGSKVMAASPTAIQPSPATGCRSELAAETIRGPATTWSESIRDRVCGAPASIDLQPSGSLT